MQGKCLTKNVVYLGTVNTKENPQNMKFYIGGTSTDFKTRYTNHKASFNNQNKMNDTSISKYVWHLKQNKKTPIIKWSILKKNPTTNIHSSTCHLCINEKLAIIKFPERDKLLNQRGEIGFSCRHLKRFTLEEYNK